MQAMIDELAKQAAESLGQVSSKETLASFWQEYLSKNGKIPALMKNLRTVAPEERPAMGKIINELKAKVQADYDAAAEQVKQAELSARNAAAIPNDLLAGICCAINSECIIRCGHFHPGGLCKGTQNIEAFAGACRLRHQYRPAFYSTKQRTHLRSFCKKWWSQGRHAPDRDVLWIQIRHPAGGRPCAGCALPAQPLLRAGTQA